MGDELLSASEEELLAHAIALSLESNRGRTGSTGGPVEGASPAGQRQPVTSTPAAPPGAGGRPEAPLRSDTTQSYDSALNEGEDSLRWQQQVSQTQLSSLRSSPDLGISQESDVDPHNGTTATSTLGVRRHEKDFQKSSRESLMSSPEAERIHPQGLQNLTLDGQNITSGGATREREDSQRQQQLPFTRLSSLHDMNLQEGGLVGGGRVREEWIPNKEALELIVGMGISENAAKRALYHTGNDNAELAVGWVYDNIGDPELHQPFKPPVLLLSTSSAGNAPLSASGEGVTEGVMLLGGVYRSYDEVTGVLSEYEQGTSRKMVLVANAGLKMGVGKLAAQVGHAVLALYHCLESQPDLRPGLQEWESRGAKKVVLRGTDAQHLLDLKEKALELGIANMLVHDAGRTQIDPGSLTILALFGLSRDLDLVTGKLKLL